MPASVNRETRLRVWLVAARLPTLSAAVAPVLVAAATRNRPCSSLQALGWSRAFSMSLTVISPMQR